MTAPGHDWRKEAASLRLAAMCWEAAAQSAETGYGHLGSVGIDLGSNVSLRLRECAREARWAATQVDMWAIEEGCQQDTDEVEAGLLRIIAGGAA